MNTYHFLSVFASYSCSRSCGREKGKEERWEGGEREKGGNSVHEGAWRFRSMQQEYSDMHCKLPPFFEPNLLSPSFILQVYKQSFRVS